MPKIKINMSGMEQLKSVLKSIKKNTADLIWELRKVKFNLDWQVKAKSNISNRISNLQKRIESQEDKLASLIRAISSAKEEFQDADRALSKDTKNLTYTLNSFSFTATTRASNFSKNANFVSGTAEEVNGVFLPQSSSATNLSALK